MKLERKVRLWFPDYHISYRGAHSASPGRQTQWVDTSEVKFDGATSKTKRQSRHDRRDHAIKRKVLKESSPITAFVPQQLCGKEAKGERALEHWVSVCD